jgi:membrane protease YdiL (CAAX protease family)
MKLNPEFLQRRSPHYLLFNTDPGRYDYRGLLAFVGVYLAAFLVAGLLAYPIYLGVLQLAARPDAAEIWVYLADKPLVRYVDRIRLLATALVLLWLIRRCELWGAFGFQWRNDRWKQLFAGFGWGVAMFVPMIGLQLLFLELEVVWPPAESMIGWLAGLLLGALLLSWVEEAIFRGMLLRMFYTAMRPWPAVLGSAFVFAIVHFKAVPWDSEAAVHLGTSLMIAVRGVFSFVYTFDFFHFSNLLLAGILLNVLFLRSGNLLVCLGLHAGWVWMRGIWGGVAEIGEQSGRFWLGGQGIVDGVVPMGVLLAAILITLSYRSKNDPQAIP